MTTEPESFEPGKTPKPQRMLYEICSMCGGTGIPDEIHFPSVPPHERPARCPAGCKQIAVVETGLTVAQAERLAELDTLRQQAGISAAMLRDGSAAAFRDLVQACEKALAAYDAAYAQNGMATWAAAVVWSGADVDEMRAAVKKAKGPYA